MALSSTASASDRRAQIVDGARTPLGSMLGVLSSVAAPRLGAACVRALVERSGIAPERVDEVVMGNVLGAGLGQNPARQAALFGGLPDSVGATTVNKVCGSGLKAVMLADQAVRLGEAGLVIAGGMESMSRAPYLLPRAREGYRLGHGELIDAMVHDGLWDVYGENSMGACGDACARDHGYTRAEQDDFAVRSFVRARQAAAAGAFRDEIVSIETKFRGKAALVTEDEGPAKFDEAKLRALRPAFGGGSGGGGADDGDRTITAGNASSISDGAAALLVASSEACERHGLAPIAAIVGAATHSQRPDQFPTAPVGAVRKLLERVGWRVSDVDLFEINEAFAVVALHAQRVLEIAPDRLNVRGGAVALGHPIGCSGARLLVTLLHALKQQGGQKGVASLCIGGGEAVAMAVEIARP